MTAAEDALPAQAAGETLVARAFHLAAQAPQRVFARVRTRGRIRTLAYGELAAAARGYCALFRAAGLAPGEVVIIILSDPPSLYASFLGAMLGGFVPAFMPPATSKQDPQIYWSSHHRLFASIQAGALITDAETAAELRARFGDASYRLIDHPREGYAAAPAAADALAPIDPATIHPDQVAFLQHSSGTTGLKKGVMLSHRAVLAQLDSYAQAIGFDAASRIVSWLPLYHDMGLVACFLLPLAAGAQVCQLDPFEWVARPWTLFDAIQDERSQYAWLPNFALNHLVNTTRPGRRWDLSSVKMIANCSEPCRTASMQGFRDRFEPMGLAPDAVQVCYAMAETVFAVTQTHGPPRARRFDRAALETQGRLTPDAHGAPIAGCGRPIAGLAVRIADPQGERLPDGRVGEIQVSGACLYSGYNRRPDLTAAALQDGWHRTGDLGALLEGELFVTGRRDDLIVSRGRNVYAHELEAVVGEVAGVTPGRVAVFGAPNPAAGALDIVCLYEPVEGADEAALRRAIRDTVEAHCGAALAKVVARPRGTLVKTTSGKISRDANRARYLDALSAAEETEA